jgi:hypothetical protein
MQITLTLTDEPNADEPHHVRCDMQASGDVPSIALLMGQALFESVKKMNLDLVRTPEWAEGVLEEQRRGKACAN